MSPPALTPRLSSRRVEAELCGHGRFRQHQCLLRWRPGADRTTGSWHRRFRRAVTALPGMELFHLPSLALNGPCPLRLDPVTTTDCPVRPGYFASRLHGTGNGLRCSSRRGGERARTSLFKETRAEVRRGNFFPLCADVYAMLLMFRGVCLSHAWSDSSEPALTGTEQGRALGRPW